MSWSDVEKDRLFGLLEAIRNLLATCCESLEKGVEKLQPKPPSSRRGKP